MQNIVISIYLAYCFVKLKIRLTFEKQNGTENNSHGQNENESKFYQIGVFVCVLNLKIIIV